MRSALLLTLVYWPSWIRAQALPSVTDTTTLNFMRWYLNADDTIYKKHYKLASNTIRWQDADINLVDKAVNFSSKLLIIQQADSASYSADMLRYCRAIWRKSGLPTCFFTRADLTAMQAQYEQETQMRWPVILSKLKHTSKQPLQQGYFKAFTLPLFSVDKQRTLLWEYKGCLGRCRSARLRAFERTATGTWRSVPASLGSWTE